MEDKMCIYCTNRMFCDKYREWLEDARNIIIPRASGCDKYEERENTGGNKK